MKYKDKQNSTKGKKLNKRIKNNPPPNEKIMICSPWGKGVKSKKEDVRENIKQKVKEKLKEYEIERQKNSKKGEGIKRMTEKIPP